MSGPGRSTKDGAHLRRAFDDYLDDGIEVVPAVRHAAHLLMNTRQAYDTHRHTHILTRQETGDDGSISSTAG